MLGWHKTAIPQVSTSFDVSGPLSGGGILLHSGSCSHHAGLAQDCHSTSKITSFDVSGPLSGGGINYFIVDHVVTMLGRHKTAIPQVSTSFDISGPLSGGGIKDFIVDLVVTKLGLHKTAIPQVMDIL